MKYILLVSVNRFEIVLNYGMIQAKIITQPELVKVSYLEDFIKESYSVEVLASTFKPKMKKKAKK